MKKKGSSTSLQLRDAVSRVLTTPQALIAMAPALLLADHCLRAMVQTPSSYEKWFTTLTLDMVTLPNNIYRSLFANPVLPILRMQATSTSTSRP